MDDVAIKVSEVDKSFKLPHERQGSLKGALLNVFKRKRSFERQRVLRNINLEIKKGEFFGIVGRNGGGKSTMLKLLAGIYSPDKGAIIVNGKLTAFIELGVGFNPELTGRENVYLSGALLGFSKKEVDGMYQDIVDFAEIPRFMDQKLKNYSSGMQVRLAFSIAIRAKSDILILDEVLAVGDAAFQQKCYDYFEELKRLGQTVVFVSHDMAAVQRFCTRAAYIKGGKLIKVGHPEEIANIYIEDNMRSERALAGDTGAKESRVSKKQKVTSKIIKKTDKSLKLQVDYTSTDDTQMYVGISFSRDGRSIAEITTDPKKPLSGSGRLTYELDTTIFNEGLYRVNGVCLFKVNNRELLAFEQEHEEFNITGHDITRGASVKLADTWVYGED